MALTGFSAANRLFASPIWAGSLPLIYSVWGWRPDAPEADFFVTLGQDGQNDNRRNLVRVGPGQLWAQSRTTVNVDAVSVVTPASQWFHAAGSWISATEMEVWLNGANKATQTASSAPAAPDSTIIGVRPDGAFPHGGAIASFSAWDPTGFSVQERDDLVAALAAGSNPLTLNAENGALIGYAELEDTNDLGPFAMQGSLSVFGSHPPVSAPTKPSTGFRRRGVRVITGADPQFPLPVRKHRQLVADPKYRRHILYQDPDAPIRRWVQVVPGPLPARKQVSIEGL